MVAFVPRNQRHSGGSRGVWIVRGGVSRYWCIGGMWKDYKVVPWVAGVILLERKEVTGLGIHEPTTVMKELKALEATANAQKKEIETLELMEMCYAKERNKILEELSAAASTPWYKKQINQYEEED
ncbi:hypothetical protein C5167_050959 [Papaver somniferum]|uniref:Uncharacterized protein n=1 Tax=Papaver somniferum TaxID=3469 RepID=A0A4Y7KRM4_PAPSO|nr:hypothetical protein C5167_050959 [Papaver somniferum]